MNKTIQDLKMEIEGIKKSQRETTLELENLGKRSGVIDSGITNRIQEIEERISCAEDPIENIATTVKENAKNQKSPNPKHPENPGHNEKMKPKDTRYRRERKFSI
jgi:predicted  nucleic acid-binding Zn-ribbon protein